MILGWDGMGSLLNEDQIRKKKSLQNKSIRNKVYVQYPVTHDAYSYACMLTLILCKFPFFLSERSHYLVYGFISDANTQLDKICPI